jgi:hypothetical protein
MRLRVFCPFTGPGRNHPAGRDDTARSDGSPASYLKVLHASRSPRWRTRNRLDNNGMRLETVERSRVGIHVSTAPESFSRPASLRRQFPGNSLRLSHQLVERRFVGRRKGTHDDVHPPDVRDDFRPGKLSQSPSQAISLHDCMPVLGDDYRHPCMRKQGVGRPNIEVLGAQPSPCFFYQLEI